MLYPISKSQVLHEFLGRLLLQTYCNIIVTKVSGNLLFQYKVTEQFQHNVTNYTSDHLYPLVYDDSRSEDHQKLPKKKNLK